MSIDRSDSMPADVIALYDYWTTHGVEVNQRLGGERLSEVEAKLRVVFPPSFRRYLEVANGTAQLDHNLFLFWSADTICTVAQRHGVVLRVPSPERALVFADYSVSAIEYAIAIGANSSEAVVYAISPPHIAEVASSFLEFVRRYIDEDPILSDPW